MWLHPWKISMEHVLMEVWKIIFLSEWVMAVGSMLIFQGVIFVVKNEMEKKQFQVIQVPTFWSQTLEITFTFFPKGHVNSQNS